MTDASAHAGNSQPMIARVARASDAMDRLLDRAIAWRVAIAVVAILQTLLIVTHANWLDEWQALQLAVQSPDVSALLDNLRYEGHPPLWYLILRGTACFVPIFLVLPVVVGVLAAISQSLILFASPFRRAERLAIALGAPMLFEYLTLSRSLSLGVCLMLLASACWQRRWVWLPIVLLPMCDFLFGALSIVLIALLARERRLWWLGLMLWLAISMVAAYLIRPAADMAQALERSGVAYDGLQWLMRVGVLLIPLQGGDHGIGWNNPPPLSTGAVLGPVFLVFAWQQTNKDRVHRLLLAGFALLTLLFSAFVYPLQVRHICLLSLLLMLLKWREVAAGTQADMAFRIWLAVGCACGLLVATLNLVQPFDTASQAARVIRERGLAGKLWLSFPDSRAQGVAALDHMEFTRLERECTQSFIRWNYRRTIKTPAALERYLRDFGKRWGRSYLLSEFPLAGVDDALHGEIREIASIPAGYDDQAYHLFVVSPDRPEGARRPPQCVPSRLPFPVH